MTKIMKAVLEERREPAAAAEGRVRRRLVAQWYRNPEGVLAMRWTTEVKLDEGNPSAALAA